MSGQVLVRGRLHAAVVPPLDVEKHCPVVSDNRRNTGLGTALVVRLTTSAEPAIPSIVVLPPGEALEGRVLCDDIEVMYPEDVRRSMGALSPPTMRAVGAAPAAALGP